ncbi:MAG: GTP-binding protein [Candidatus Shapirobacteria bacterium]|nr:GTP-binding protein [Candidatus Shapirobacteria bacterium]
MNTDLNQTPTRPPVVALMGHIDHGKTSLLDRICQSHLQSKEIGGITQHIGAYQITLNGDQKITFVDTPGHKAFEKMRARGALVTDLVVLVIAADEGIKPQTKECLEHIRAAQVPFLIALNKIDLPGVNQEEIKNKLTQFGVVTEDRGGDVVLVPVSAKTGQGIDELLEMIVLLAQMSDLSFLSKAPFVGVVIESCLDCQKGNLVTVIVKQGQLSVGQEIFFGNDKVKVKALFNDLGHRVKEAFISQPVSILGFVNPPPVGSLVGDSQLDTDLVDSKKDRPVDVSEKSLLKLVVKADTQGTLEALINSLPKEDLAIVRTGVGDINDSDVFFASSTGAEIIGFNVRLSRLVADLAKEEQVAVQTEEIIYQLLQSIEEKVTALKVSEENKKILGEAEIIADFKVPDGRVAGARVITGLIKNQTEVFIVRPGKADKKTKIISLRQGHKKIEQAEKDQEFGVIFSPNIDFKIGDMIKYRQS